MWNEMKPFVLCAATLALTAGCTHTTAVAPTPAAETAPAAATAAKTTKGTVLEVIEAGRYCYINVDSGSAKTWFAVPFAELKVGDKVEVQQGMELKNYHAKSLNRDFESITFSDGFNIVKGGKTGVMPANHPAIPGAEVTVSGKVTEIIKGADFNYVSVDEGGAKTWLTVPAATKVTVGEETKFLPGRELRNFVSEKLKRTFDRIIISGGVDAKK